MNNFNKEGTNLVKFCPNNMVKINQKINTQFKSNQQKIFIISTEMEKLTAFKNKK